MFSCFQVFLLNFKHLHSKQLWKRHLHADLHQDVSRLLRYQHLSCFLLLLPVPTTCWMFPGVFQLLNSARRTTLGSINTFKPPTSLWATGSLLLLLLHSSGSWPSASVPSSVFQAGKLLLASIHLLTLKTPLLHPASELLLETLRRARPPCQNSGVSRWAGH